MNYNKNPIFWTTVYIKHALKNWQEPARNKCGAFIDAKSEPSPQP